ncbi:MAG: SAM-dependent methyltransferase, partial [Bacteroidetes bacterium HGW-Bacteroidetes-20]
MNKLTPEIVTFIQDHIHDDLPKLILKKGANIQNIDYSFAFQQIGARQKAKTKLPDWFSNFNLLFPVSLSVEQSSSQQTAQYKATLFEGDHLIDLSAGFGVDAFYLSSNFSQTTLVETNLELCDILRHNANELHLDSIKVINANAENYLEQIDPNSTQKKTFYIDPARRGKQGEKLIDLGDCEPNILNIKDQLLTMGEKVCIKLSP